MGCSTHVLIALHITPQKMVGGGQLCLTTALLTSIKRDMDFYYKNALRRTLSEELHARTFHDFDGAGRFIPLSFGWK